MHDRSGGFIAPFMQPDLVWDFRLPNIKSINASGHKFGLVYAGIGWLAFRCLPVLTVSALAPHIDLHAALVQRC